jgi:stage III sporulation protein AE
MKRARWLLWCALVLCLAMIPANACAQEVENLLDPWIDEQLKTIPLDDWDDVFRDMGESAGIKDLVREAARGNAPMDLKEWIRLLGRSVRDEWGRTTRQLAIVLLISMLCAVLANLKANMRNGQVAKIAKYCGFLLVAGLLLSSVFELVNLCGAAVDRLSDIVQQMFPVLLALMLASGEMTGQGLLQPLVATAAGGASVLFHAVIIPLIVVDLAVVTAGSLGAGGTLRKLHKLIQKLCKWLIGAVFTLFFGVLAIQGIAATTFDGMAARTARYAVENVVPVAGKMFAQSVDLVFSGSILLKNAVGVVGMAALAGICIKPVIRLFLMILCLRLAAAVTEPLMVNPVTESLEGYADAVTTLAVSIGAVGVLFFIMTAVVLGMGNAVLMMRG